MSETEEEARRRLEDKDYRYKVQDLADSWPCQTCIKCHEQGSGRCCQHYTHHVGDCCLHCGNDERDTTTNQKRKV